MSHGMKYFGTDDADQTVAYLDRKAGNWFAVGNTNGYLELIKRSWRTYHGFVTNNPHTIDFEGEQGELLKINNNHFWNIAENIIVLVTANRPKFTARAINTDKKSMVQAELANGILDYYMRIKHLERHIKRAVKYAVVTGTGYVKMEWNSTKGEIYDYIEPDAASIAEFNDEGQPVDDKGNVLAPIPVYQGDIEFKTLGFFDVIFDTTKDSPDDHDWVVTRTFINKYDLAEKYPDLKDDILAISMRENTNGLFSFVNFDQTTDVPVYEFFHNRTESCPDGRHLTYLNSTTVLSDTLLEYERIPVYRMSPGEIIGTSFGFSPMFNLIQLQEYLDMLYSTVLTNQYTFGVQNVITPMGSNVKLSSISGGLNFIEYNASAGPAPAALNLTASPAEIFNTIELIKKDMETISGINATVRGSPESQVRSGTSMAMMASQSLQFLSGIQHSYIQLLEDVGTGVINLLKKFASAPRILSIVGNRNATKVEEFKSDDLSEIDRVVVDVGNGLMSSVAGKVEIAQNLLQYGAIKSLDKFVQVIQTGNLDSLLENEMDKLDLIRGENEEMVKGQVPVRALYFDDHVLHIQEHQAVLADSKRRMDNDLVQRVTSHIQEHIDLLKSLDPFVAGIVGQPAAPPPMPKTPPMPDQTNLTEAMANPEAQSVAPQDQLNPPTDLPRPPKPLEEMPVTAEQAFIKNSK